MKEQLANNLIVLDPGHGGATSVGRSSPNNASSPNGLLEKNLTLAISVKVAELLNKGGYRVMLTRNNDTNNGLRERAQVAASNNATVFVSIHFNGNTDPAVQGTEVWVHPASTADSRLLGSSLLQRLVAATGLRNRGLKSNDWGVLNPGVHSMGTASCLIEISFITNPTEGQRLSTDVYKNQLANAIKVAIVDFINRATTITPLNPTPGLPSANDGDV